MHYIGGYLGSERYAFDDWYNCLSFPVSLQALFKQFEEDDIPVLHMSTLTETGVIEVRNQVRRLM